MYEVCIDEISQIKWHVSHRIWFNVQEAGHDTVNIPIVFIKMLLCRDASGKKQTSQCWI